VPVIKSYTAIEVKFTPVQVTKAQKGSTVRDALVVFRPLDGGGWSTLHHGRFTPGKDSVPFVQEVGWARGPV